MHDLWLWPEGPDKWKLLEEMFSQPPENRLEWMKEHIKVQHLGSTDKSGPEIAVDLIKKGVRAKSYGFKSKKPLTKETKSDNL